MTDYFVNAVALVRVTSGFQIGDDDDADNTAAVSHTLEES